MKILTSNWEIKQTCTGFGNGNLGCGANLLVDEEDIFVTFLDDYRTPQTEYFYTFKCPVCGRLTDIPSELLPKDVKEKAMKHLGKR